MNNFGFSLYELLITLAIALILAAFAVPSQYYFFQKAQEDHLASQLLQAIEMTRNEAIARGEVVTLCKSTDAKTCGGQWEKGYIVSGVEKTLHVYKTVQNNGVIHWRAFPNSLGHLQFSPSGSTNAENGTFWYCRDNTSTPSWAIVISKTGRARIMDGHEAAQALSCL